MEGKFKFLLVAWDGFVHLLRWVDWILIFRKIRNFNKALLVIWLWHFGQEVSHLWCWVIESLSGRKEGVGGWDTRVGKGTHKCSLWQRIKASWDGFFQHVVFQVGDDNCVRFWFDPWSGHPPMRDLYLTLFECLANKDAIVSDVLKYQLDGVEGMWNLRFHRL